MTLIIQKFGGTSLGTVARIQHAADIIFRTLKKGHQVIAVVSAMQGETDRLIQLAAQAADRPNPREYDRLVSAGECISSALLAMALQEKSIEAVSMTGADAHILTTNCHQNASITDIKIDRLKTLLTEKKVPVVTGFQGISALSEVTTLGRGGSDITAVAIAAAMGADECQIYTDVDGVYTSDPRVVDDAKLIERITYAEMLALSRLGAKVLHRQSVAFAEKCGVPVRVLSSFKESRGTLVTGHQHIKTPWVSGVAFEQSQAKLSILGIPKGPVLLSQMQKGIEALEFDVDMSVENYSAASDTVDYSFTVHSEDYRRAFEFANKMAQHFSAKKVVSKEDIAKLSLVGMGMHSHAGLASKVFQTLSEKDIPIYLIASTEAKISTVIDKKNMQKGAQLLHRTFIADTAKI